MSVQEQTHYEQVVAKIWSEILKKDEIDVHDDFFELGGTSLQLINVVREMGERFGMPLDTTIVLEGATIASLAKAVQRLAGADSDSQLQVASKTN